MSHQSEAQSAVNDFTMTFYVPAPPAEAFDAASHPERWWNVMITGQAGVPGGTFVYDVPGLHHSEFAVTQSSPSRRLVWRVSESGLENELHEWIGTECIFEFTPDGAGTTVTFTHRGLTSHLDCHDVCTTAWTHHLNVGLRELLTTGRAAPLTAESIEEVAAKVGARPGAAP